MPPPATEVGFANRDLTALLASLTEDRLKAWLLDVERRAASLRDRARVMASS
jgi:hypothetical protein